MYQGGWYGYGWTKTCACSTDAVDPLPPFHTSAVAFSSAKETPFMPPTPPGRGCAGGTIYQLKGVYPVPFPVDFSTF